MKKLMALLMALVLCCTAALAELKVTLPDVSAALPAQVSGLTVTWYPTAVGYRCVMTWQADGCDYEAAVNGLKEQLTDDQLALLLAAWRQRTRAVIGGGVVDAEKTTNRLGESTGQWLVTDTEERQRDCWGDNSMCWAAATANMLWATGWAQKAVNPLTGAAFTSEDEVYALFVRHFLNKGGWSAHGVRWFFTGSCDLLDLPERWNDGSVTRIEGYDPLDYIHSTMNEQNPVNTVPAAMADFAAAIRRIRYGAVVGGSVGFNEEYHHMPDDENDSVWWSAERGQFVRSILPAITAEDCEQRFYSFDDIGRIKPLTEQNGAYVDEAGEAVDPLWVLSGLLYHSHDEWWLVDVLGDDQLMVSVQAPAEGFDMNDVQQSNYAAHQHAITLMGYVMNLSAQDPGDAIEALIVANSDDDGAIWRMTPENADPAQRPNKLILYPTSIHDSDDGAELRTLCLHDFMDHNLTLLNHVDALDPAAD